MVVAQTSSSVLGIPVPRSLLSRQCVEIFHSLWRFHLCCLRFSPTRGSWYRLVSRLIGPKASSTSFHKFSFPIFSQHLSSTSVHQFSVPIFPVFPQHLFTGFLSPAIFRTRLSSHGGRFICFYCIRFTILCSCWSSKPPHSTSGRFWNQIFVFFLF